MRGYSPFPSRLSISNPDIGNIQIGDAAEYGYKHGYVIEEYGENGWGVPDWTERSLPHLDGVFNTRLAAQKAIEA